jgi:membrane protease YdiL (CAAX protease family)
MISLKPENWIKAAPEGTWTRVHSGLSGGLTVALSLMMVVFFGLMTTGLGQIQQPVEGFSVIVDSLSAIGVGLFYMVIVSLYLAGWWIESTEESKTPLAIIDMGPTRNWLISLPIGFVIGIGFVGLMKFTLGSFFPFESLTLFGVDIAAIILFAAPVIAIPIAEELFFGGLMTPTFAESLGIVPASLLIGLVWILWHLGTYSNSVDILVALFAFRFVTTYIILLTDSLVAPMIAHIMINAAGILLTF